jgi:hypothetical protein
MALTLVQTPATVSLAQSPIIFTANESGPEIYYNAFQYVGELYYWDGAEAGAPVTPDYVLLKYPNFAGNGIFDVSRIINSTLTDLAVQNTSNVKYFKLDVGWQWLSGSTYVTSSTKVSSGNYKALDGYGIFQETIGQSIQTTTPFWPLMTDGPASQSCFLENKGTAGVYVGTTGGTQPTKIVYTSNLGTADYTLSTTTATSGQIAQYPIGPSQTGFPLSTVGMEYFTVQPYAGGTALGQPITYTLSCQQKYPNVRVRFKNRFGQFDWFNFYMVNRQGFQTTRKTYQPQLGTFQDATLSYNSYDSSVLNYIADSKQTLQVNTDWLDDEYNEIWKQLLVSDEIYWQYGSDESGIRPITISTESITFKTSVVDKLVQYSFDFNFGQAYKLII